MHASNSAQRGLTAGKSAFLDTFNQRMLPRAEMVAIKNSPQKTLLFLALALLLGLAGCTPPGPRALLEGDKLLRAGKPSEAIDELRLATDLLPGEPRAWNLLGLAYHRAGQPQPAIQAYRQALLRDRSNLVSVTHFNLGCLLLEQNTAAGAVDALRSYTLITNNPAGFARLGSAQLRLRQYADAEKSFVTALRWDAKNAEALNGLGVARVLRGQRDAAQYFTAALQSDAKYPPALLNSAVLAHQSSATKPAALQRYRDYLAAQGSGGRTDAVKLLMQQLESELAPAPTPPPAKVVEAPKTSPPPVAVTKTIPPTAPVVVIKTNPPVTIQKTNPVVAVTNKPAAPPAPVTIVAVQETAPPKFAVTEPPVVRKTPAPVPTPKPEPIAETPPAFIVPESKPAPTTPEKKRGFFSKLNPFSGGKPKLAPTEDVSRTIILNPDSAPSTLDLATRAPDQKPSFPRYRYLTPTPPAAGDRATADRALQQALAAQRAGRTTEARSAFATALAADASYFEAHYNSALLAFQSGENARALAGWETALALQPDSLAARYSFALTLKQAGHATDAANELEKIIEAKPDDARAHLALGNLYAQQLLEPMKARAHYKKFLDLEPRSPQAAAIRYWLSANP